MDKSKLQACTSCKAIKYSRWSFDNQPVISDHFCNVARIVQISKNENWHSFGLLRFPTRSRFFCSVPHDFVELVHNPGIPLLNSMTKRLRSRRPGNGGPVACTVRIQCKIWTRDCHTCIPWTLIARFSVRHKFQDRFKCHVMVPETKLEFQYLVVSQAITLNYARQSQSIYYRTFLCEFCVKLSNAVLPLFMDAMSMGLIRILLSTVAFDKMCPLATLTRSIFFLTIIFSTPWKFKSKFKSALTESSIATLLPVNKKARSKMTTAWIQLYVILFS